MKSNKPLSGREASVLALLAQCLHIPQEIKQRILSTLEGRALKIAQVMCGEKHYKDKDIIDAANGFLTWAESLHKVKIQ